MKLGSVIHTERRAVEDILSALRNRLTAEDNLAPAGTAGQVLMSNGENEPPSWQDVPAPTPSAPTIDGLGTVGALALWLDQDTLGDAPVTYVSGVLLLAPAISTAVVGDMTVTGFVSASTELRSPSLDTVGNTDLLINRNNVLQLTIGSLLAAFAGDVSSGTAPATTGNFRLPYNGSIYGRDAADAADLRMLMLHTGLSADTISLGSDNVGDIFITQGTGGKWRFDGTNYHLLPHHNYPTPTDLQDIGGTSNRLRDIHIGRSAVFGATPAVGTQPIRLTNNTSVSWRNFANNNNVGINVDTSDNLNLGVNANRVDIEAPASFASTTVLNTITYTWPASQAANRLLKTNGSGTLSWAQAVLTTDVTGTLPATNGGTGTATVTLGDLLYGSATNVWSKLAGNATATKLYLTQTGTGSASAAPAWSALTVAPSELSGFGADGGYLRSNGLAWVRVSGIAAADVTAGTFGAGAYTFPSTLVVTSTLTQNGTSALLAQGASGSLQIGAAASTQSDLIIRGAATTQRNFWLYTGTTARWNGRANVTAETGSDAGSNYDFIAYNDAGAQIDIVYRITRAANGTIAFASNRPITGGTYNGQTISSAASFTGTVAIASSLTLSAATNFYAAAGTTLLRANTSDGADTQRLIIAGGGSGTSTRGAYIVASGNENATSAGQLQLVAGDTGSIVMTGAVSISSPLTSTLATGTAPFVVASTTKVANLNADLLDDQTGSYYLDVANLTGTTLPASIVTSSLTTIGTLVAGGVPASLVIAGTLSGAFTFDTDIAYSDSDFIVAANTADASDSSRIAVAGGGAVSSLRGAYIRLSGNEHASTAGRLEIVSGSAGYVTITSTHSSSSMQLLGSGGINIAASGSTVTVAGIGTYIIGAVSTLYTRISGNNAVGTGAYIDLYGTSHANAGRLDIVSGGSAALTLTSASGQIECADDIDLASGQVLRVNGTQVVAAQGAAVADATGAGDVVAQLNALLARVRAHGLIAT